MALGLRVAVGLDDQLDRALDAAWRLDQAGGEAEDGADVDVLARARRGPRPVIAPAGERADDRHQLARALGELVVDPRRHLAVALAGEQAVGHHPVQPRAELLGRDPGQDALEFDEPPRPGGEVADDQQRPLVAHQIERARVRRPLVVRMPLRGRDGRYLGPREVKFSGAYSPRRSTSLMVWTFGLKSAPGPRIVPHGRKFSRERSFIPEAGIKRPATRLPADSSTGHKRHGRAHQTRGAPTGAPRPAAAAAGVAARRVPVRPRLPVHVPRRRAGRACLRRRDLDAGVDHGAAPRLAGLRRGRPGRHARRRRGARRHAAAAAGMARELARRGARRHARRRPRGRGRPRGGVRARRRPARVLRRLRPRRPGDHRRGGRGRRARARRLPARRGRSTPRRRRSRRRGAACSRRAPTGCPPCASGAPSTGASTQVADAAVTARLHAAAAVPR